MKPSKYLCSCHSFDAKPAYRTEGKQYFKCGISGHLCKVIEEYEVVEHREGEEKEYKIKKQTRVKDYIKVDEL